MMAKRARRKPRSKTRQKAQSKVRPKVRSKAKARPKARKTAKATRKTAPKRSAKRLAKRSAKRPTPKAKGKAKDKIETLATPPSSLNLDRTPSAARSGAKTLEDTQRRRAKFAALTSGDVDADAEGAYFSGDEAPGGDNMTPDQQNVEEIGQALGVHYGDNQELQGGEEVAERDKHRWENE